MNPISTLKAKLGQLRKRRGTLVVVVVVFFALILVLTFGSVLVYIPYDALVNGPKAKTIQKDLEGEFNRIAPLLGAIRLRFDSMNKTNQGDVGGDYKTAKSYSEIRAHYDEDLARNGWKFVKEKPVKIWGHDYGGKEAFYCKGIYTATLESSGGAPGLEWTYSFGLSWGLFDECG